MKQSWEIKKLGEVVNIVNGRNQSSVISESGQYPIYGSSGNLMGYATDYLCEEGTTIIGRKGNISNPIYIEEKFWNVDTAFGLYPKNGYEPKFINYLCQTIDFKSRNRGTTIPSLVKSDLLNIDVPFISSLPEQQRIVSILDETFAAIAKAKANAEQNLKNAKELFESYLQGVFEKKGDVWEENTLEELADEKCTLSYGIVQPGEEFENGLPVIRPTDLTSRYIKVEGLKRIDPKLADGYKKTKLNGDELLLCVRGTTGIVSIATPELKDANVTRGIVPIRFNPKILNQEFGYYLLISNYVQKQIRAKTYGAALMQINIGDLRKILTPYPPLKDQQTIVRQLDALRAETQKLEAVYQKKIEDLEELKKSILQKAFVGEISHKIVEV